MKIFELLETLTEEEMKYVRKYFHSSNDNLKMLFNEIKKLDKPNFIRLRPQIYRKVYGKAWTDSHEKYLKNQLTDLFDELRNFVSQYWLRSTPQVIEINKGVSYLQVLNKRLKSDLFDKEWNYFHKVYESVQNYYGLKELYIMKYNYLIKNPKNAKEALNCIDLAYRYLIKANCEDIATIKYTAFTLNYQKQIYGFGENIDNKYFDNILAETDTSQPMDLAVNLVLETDLDKKWVYAESIFEILSDEGIFIKTVNKFRLVQSVFNLSILLMDVGKFVKAKKIVDFIEEFDLINMAVANPAVFYFNQSTLELKLGNIELGIEIHKKVMSNLVGVHENRVVFFELRDILLNLLTNNLENIYNQINEVSTKLFNDDQHMYVRILLTVYLIKLGDITSANRECENAKKSVYYKSKVAEEEVTVINIIHSLLLVQMKEKVSETKLMKLESEILNSEFWNKSTNLFKRWISEYIEELKLKI